MSRGGETTTASMEVYEGATGETHVAGLVTLYAQAPTPLDGVYRLSAPKMVIGRDDGCEIRLDANAVSRRHAVIERDASGFKITDMGSRNGTLVDGAFVASAYLEHGSEVRIGDAIFKFVERGAQTWAGYRYDGTMEPGHRRLASEATMLLGGAQMDRIVASLEKIARTPLSVILHGESGTGKEVAASEVHRLSGRKGAFVPVNCAAIPQALLESELFGYRRGAFSGADRDKVGLVKAAHGGTLFLDEIGDMPIEAQAKLLRVIQMREVMPVGATATEPVDVRIVCATHRDLAVQQAKGAFRGDLFARLNEYAVLLPPLRDRKEDVYLLTRAMLGRQGRLDVVPTFPFFVGLVHYDWPFNVRELEACIKRALALAEGRTLEASHLPDALREAMSTYGRRDGHTPPPPPPMGPERHSQPPGAMFPPPSSIPTSRAQAPSEAELRQLLAYHRGNVAAVGRVLGKERMQIHRWMKRYSIDISEYR
jgi:transcriptional regulator with GAF, ATPase, and Fis domain